MMASAERGRSASLPEGAMALDEAFVAALVPARDPGGHKGTFGTLLAVCGSLDYAGAALLAGVAALRTGAGLVVLCVPASLQPVVAGRVPELITLGLPEGAPFEVDPEAAAAVLAARHHTGLLVGPGLRPGVPSARLVDRLIGGPASSGAGAPPAAVLDAEALNGLAQRRRWWTRLERDCVLTPHPGEFARLDGAPVGPTDEERSDRARAAAARWRQVIVLKGARTVVAAPDGRVAVASFANAALGTGGTGDILAGAIGSLVAQGSDPWAAACLGVYLHGTAAEHVSERVGDAGLLASDLLPELPRVRRHLSSARDRGVTGRRLGFLPQPDGA
jgi:NAD(P)H-hydrate epimerase